MSTNIKAPSGSYLLTSRSISFTPRPHGRFVLRAQCRRYLDDNSYLDSELVYDIANNDGKLEWAPHGCKSPVTPTAEATHAEPPEGIPAGTYLLTSKDVQLVDVGRNRYRLEADCQKLDGSYVRSKLDYDIVNCDGKLMWDPHGKHVEAMYAAQGPRK